jgi:hypothetical protein
MSKSYIAITLGNYALHSEGVVRRHPCNGDCANCARSRAAATGDAIPQSPSREPNPAPTHSPAHRPADAKAGPAASVAGDVA